MFTVVGTREPKKSKPVFARYAVAHQWLWGVLTAYAIRNLAQAVLRGGAGNLSVKSGGNISIDNRRPVYTGRSDHRSTDD